MSLNKAFDASLNKAFRASLNKARGGGGPTAHTFDPSGSYRFADARLTVQHFKRISVSPFHELLEEVTCTPTFMAEGVRALVTALFRPAATGAATMIEDWYICPVNADSGGFSSEDTWAAMEAGSLGWSTDDFIGTGLAAITAPAQHWVRTGGGVDGLGANCFWNTGSINDPLGVSTPRENYVSSGNILTAELYIDAQSASPAVYNFGPITSPPGFVFSFTERLTGSPIRRAFLGCTLSGALSDGHGGGSGSYSSFLTAKLELDLEIL